LVVLGFGFPELAAGCAFSIKEPFLHECQVSGWVLIEVCSPSDVVWEGAMGRDEAGGKRRVRDMKAVAKAVKASESVMVDMDVDVADWMNPKVQVQEVAGRGRGVVAVEALEVGELLVISNAVALAEGKDSVTAFDLRTGREVSSSEFRLVRVLLEMCWRRAGTLERIGRLYAGLGDRPEVGEGGVGMIDRGWIERIVGLNSFRLQSDYIPIKEVGVAGLWENASYFNHSCVANGHRVFVGPLVLVRASRGVSRGEEVTLRYVAMAAPRGREADEAVDRVWLCVQVCDVCGGLGRGAA
jgi:hypothetical protein